MNILTKKITNYECEYTITREDASVEVITLDVKTYLIHDITHFVVEKHLGYGKGFWGMLAAGHSFNELFGKKNKLTAELRHIEKIVGPIQSVFLGYISKQDFPVYIEHLDFIIKETTLENCLMEIKTILEQWEQLTQGNALQLIWP
jgi:hypothetical protein